MKYFMSSDRLIANISGIPFEQMTPHQRNRVRILNMFFSNPDVYHDGLVDEIKEFAPDVALSVGDEQTDNDVTYVVISGNLSAPVNAKPDRDEMIVKLANATKIQASFIETWDDDTIETAFVNLNLMPKPSTQKPMLGYLLMDKNNNIVRFKATKDNVNTVIQQFNEVVSKELLNSTPA